MRVEYYEHEDGLAPAEEFILQQPMKMRAKILRNLCLLEELGPALREPYSSSIGDALFEIRSKVGSDITRVLYFFYDGDKAVLTNGFVKKTRKTPHEEIDKARRYREDYLRRVGKK